MPSIGLTGTVGCGKSTALRFLEELGAETLAADKVGHEIIEDPETRREVVALFGEEVLGPRGELDRGAIGKRVFGDQEERRAYDALIRPKLLARLREWLARPREKVAVLEAALIPEWGIEEWFDEVWCLVCSDETALARWSRDEKLYWNIRKAQYAPVRKKAKAERVIENERSQEELRGRIHDEWERFHRDHGG
jgi:dephospho-CoA kinase